ncbi:ECF RNA polymerase sigma factor SigW [Paenibacillus solanacearum]|uniref:ECF RNA polymerase sigma factor SigW n=1 Tax=Paenibacillus solanacearum TaxID=2048548 RepID=A0A916NLM8_9BACL|nr:ECF RNA polymerase sigma factor SigW [Paenibacillus solanacearum]
MTEKELFQTYNQAVYRTCYFMLHHAADAEDVCQEVFMTVFRHDWRTVEHLKTWLMRVTVNHCLNHLKKDQRARTKHKRLELEPTPVTEKAAETIAEERETAMEAIHLLRELPGKMKAVVSLRYLNECSLNEIADILGIPVGTVKSRLNKGLKRMRQLMTKGESQRGKDGQAYGQGGTNLCEMAE